MTPEQLNILIALGTAVLGAVLGKAHAAGYKMPILSKLFDWINGAKPPATPTPAPAPDQPAPSPAAPSDHPILDAVRKLLGLGAAVDLAADATTGAMKLSASVPPTK